MKTDPSPRFVSIAAKCLFSIIVPALLLIPGTFAADLPHAADFLTNPACQNPFGTMFYLNASKADRDACRAATKSRGYSHVYLSIASEKKNYYSDPITVASRLKELTDDNLEPVVWLTSDTGEWRNGSIDTIKNDLSAFIPQINQYVSSYVVGLEADEYWTKDKTRQVGNHLRTLTNKKIAVHQLSVKWDYCQGEGWCDYLILQYGFGKSEEFIADATKKAIAELGKPVVAGEYSNRGTAESTSTKLGNAAVVAGAAGFGNGGTPKERPANTGNDPGYADNLPPQQAGDTEGFCHTILNSALMPNTQYYAPPFDILSSTAKLLITVYCNSTTLEVTLGDGGDSTFVYSQGYLRKNNNWSPYTLTGPYAKNADGSENRSWVVGKASTTVPHTGLDLAAENYLLGFVCKWTGNAWKCGCRDATCATGYWQLQIFKKKGGSSGNPGNGNTGNSSDKVFAHKADFLTTPCLTHVFAGRNAADRKKCLDEAKNRNYTHFYLYAYNENDYGGPSFDFYQKPAEFKSLLQEVRDAGLEPVVWLNPDDASTNKARSDSDLKNRMSALIPVIDSLVSSYVLGLELDEYWNQSKVDTLGNHLRTLTSKKIGAHQLPGRWGFCKSSWCDYMILQYGFGKPESAITNMTKKAIADLGKPIVAGEYNDIKSPESQSIKLGNAGVAAGASGFGNGGTP